MTQERELYEQLQSLAEMIGRSVDGIDRASSALIALIDLQRENGSGEPPRIAANDGAGGSFFAASGPEADSGLRRRAIALLSERKLRHQKFGDAMFGEPAWDMLLALYVRDWTGARFTPTSLGENVHAASSSATRWLVYLDREQLIVREEHPTDRRKCFVAISDKGRALLEEHLRALADLDAKPRSAGPGVVPVG